MCGPSVWVGAKRHGAAKVEQNAKGTAQNNRNSVLLVGVARMVGGSNFEHRQGEAVVNMN